LITAKMQRTGHSSYSITRDRGAPEVADSGGPPAMGRWAGGASPPLPFWNPIYATVMTWQVMFTLCSDIKSGDA